MAKKQLTLEEYKAKAEKKAEKSKNFGKVFLGSIAVLLSLVIVFSAVSLAFTYMANIGKAPVASGSVSSDNSSSNAGEIIDNSGTEETPDWDAEEPTGDASGDDAASNDGANGGDNSTNAGESDDKGLTTPKAQYDLFVKAFKGVKTSAKSATLVKKNAYNYKNHVKAGALSALGETLMGSLLKAEDVNETYTGADIAKNFPPAGQTCNLKTSDIQAINCKEEGSFYVITIKVKAEVNPKFGYGVGSVATILTKESIQEPIANVPLINKIEPKCSYEVTEVTAKIDKATGNMVEYYFNLPMILFMDSYEIGLGFEEWWTVAY